MESLKNVRAQHKLHIQDSELDTHHAWLLAFNAHASRWRSVSAATAATACKSWWRLASLRYHTYTAARRQTCYVIATCSLCRRHRTEHSAHHRSRHQVT